MGGRLCGWVGMRGRREEHLSGRSRPVDEEGWAVAGLAGGLMVEAEEKVRHWWRRGGREGVHLMTSQCTACASSQPERPEPSHTELSIRRTSTISDANTIGNAEKPSQRRFRRCQNQELTPPPRRDRTGQPRAWRGQKKR